MSESALGGMDYGGLITIGAGLVGGATAPDRPNIAPYEPELLDKRNIEDYAPELKSLVSAQADIAGDLLRGELPKGVVDQIKMFAGEAAQRGGFASSPMFSVSTLMGVVGSDRSKATRSPE